MPLVNTFHGRWFIALIAAKNEVIMATNKKAPEPFGFNTFGLDNRNLDNLTF